VEQLQNTATPGANLPLAAAPVEEEALLPHRVVVLLHRTVSVEGRVGLAVPLGSAVASMAIVAWAPSIADRATNLQHLLGWLYD